MRHRPFHSYTQFHPATDKWTVSISRRLTGRRGQSGSTGERRELLNADGDIATFDSKSEALNAADIGLLDGGPWSPVTKWVTL